MCVLRLITSTTTKWRKVNEGSSSVLGTIWMWAVMAQWWDRLPPTIVARVWIYPAARFSKVPETCRARKAVAKSRTLRLQNSFIYIFLIWTEVLFIQEVSGVYTPPLLYTEWTKNGFTGPKSFRGFRETVPRCSFWVDFIDGSRPCSEGFSPGSLVFLPPQKPTFPNSNSIRIKDQHENQLRLMWRIFLFIYLFS